RKVADALEQLPAVDYLVMTAGSFDLMVEVVCEDEDDLIELLNGTIRAIPGVTATETLVEDLVANAYELVVAGLPRAKRPIDPLRRTQTD
ncbi:Lrp/AsnC ligand binding domain-containing protein, partial [Bacillus sp. S34]|nr:Lrp/AsnC ligand binding domain-containing protein [Bacillus sp. S34]